MAIACQPSALLAAAKCISCLTPSQRRMVATSMLCQIANTGISTVTVPTTPTGFSFLPTDLSGNTVVASWNIPPAGVVSTEVWTSTDNITFTLAQTVAAPGTTANLPYGAAGVKNYCQIRWVNSAGQSPFTPSIFIPAEVPIWIKAVVTNGGAQVSQNTALAMNTFAISLVNGAVDTLMQAVVCFVPDNLTAAITPLYKTKGNDPWTNSNFVGADLSVNGLAGNASTKVLDTGVVPTTAWVNNAGNIQNSTNGGISVYNFTLGTVASGFDVGTEENIATPCIGLSVVFTPTSNNNCFFDFANNTVGAGRISVANTGWTGFTCGVRFSGTSQSVYQASSTHAFSTLGTNAGNVVGNALPAISFACFGYKSSGGVVTANSNRTLSFAALHFGLNAAQAQTLYNAVQALRTALGGGFV